MEDAAGGERERFQTPAGADPDAGNAPRPTRSFTAATAGSPAPASAARDRRASNGVVVEELCRRLNEEEREIVESRERHRPGGEVVRWVRRQRANPMTDHFQLHRSQQRPAAGGSTSVEEPETALARRRPRAAGHEGGAKRRRFVTRPVAELSTWNQEQLRLLKHAERRRWGSLVMMSLEAQQGELSDGAAAHFEKAAAAFSFMVFRYRGYLPVPLRRKFMKHRQAVNAFTEVRRGTRPPEDLLEFCGVGDEPFGPFGQHEERYVNTANANDPPNGGCWSWTTHNIVENQDM